MALALNFLRNVSSRNINRKNIITSIHKKMPNEFASFTTAKESESSLFSIKALERHRKVLGIMESNKYIRQFSIDCFYYNSLELVDIQGSHVENIRGLYDAIYQLLYKESDKIDIAILEICNKYLLKDIYTIAGVEDSCEMLFREIRNDLYSRIKEEINKINSNIDEEVGETIKVDESVKC